MSNVTILVLMTVCQGIIGTIGYFIKSWVIVMTHLACLLVGAYMMCVTFDHPNYLVDTLFLIVYMVINQFVDIKRDSDITLA